MKKLYTLSIVLVFGLSMIGTVAFARGRQTSGGNQGSSTSRSPSASTTTRPPSASTTSRPPSASTTTRPPSTSTTTRPPSTSTTTRPPAASSRPTTPTPSRPAGSATTSPSRPGGSTTTQRPATPPGNNASVRPSTPNTRPTPPPTHSTTPSRPATPPPPAVRPTPPPPPMPPVYRPDYSYHPPMRYTPPSYYYYRPTPPPTWRPTYTTPNFGTILGLVLGSAISNSVNWLLNNQYVVAGYNANQIFMNNVNYCNVVWPNVTMYYNNGFLQGSLFSASTISYDMSRYNYVYNYLTGMYGLPVTTQSLNSGGISCTWWGYDRTYLTLSYYPEYVSGLGIRYFTTLSTGN